MQQARKFYAGPHTSPNKHQGREPYSSPRAGLRVKKLKLFFILCTCFVLSLVVVAQYSSLIVLNYQFSEARADLKSLQGSTRTLELEAAQLGSIGRIEEIARGELGMVEPANGQLIILSAGREDILRAGE